MAGIILKSPYLKPYQKKNVAGYLKYIATRQGVQRAADKGQPRPVTKRQKEIISDLLKRYPDSRELYEYGDYLKSPTCKNADEWILRVTETYPELNGDRQNYVSYMANRPRAEKIAGSGLFTDDGKPVVLAEAMREVEAHTGNIWTHIISLRREDAERLGYNTVGAWMALLRSQRNVFAKEMRIAPEHFRWYAAFHNESHHPHVHMMAFSSDPQEPYLNREGIRNIKAALAHQIFQQDLISIYERQTERRDQLRTHACEIAAELAAGGTSDNPKLEAMFGKLSERLKNTGGKKQYGYLKADVKALVNAIVDEMQKDERIQKLYDLWYEQRFAILRTYTDAMPEKVPLSENKEFRSVKNAVIREAARLSAGDITLAGGDVAEEFPIPEGSGSEEEEPKEARQNGEYEKLVHRGNKNRWEHYRLAKLCLDEQSGHYAPREAIQWLLKAAKQDFDPAQYRLGKMLLRGDLVEQDIPYAMEWLGKAAAHGNPYAEYLLGKELVRGESLPKDPERGLELLERSAARKNRYAQYLLGTLYLKGKETPRCTEKALRLITAAADQGLEAAEYAVGRLLLLGDENLPKQPRKALPYLERAAGKGNTSARYLLGRTYLRGEELPKDIPRGLWYLESAAGQNHQWAQLLLGRLYLYGQVVEQDTEKALALLNASAMQGNPYAAAVMKHRLDFQKAAIEIGVLRLWESVFRIFQNRLSDQEHRHNPIDRRQLRQINEKKLAQGLRPE